MEQIVHKKRHSITSSSDASSTTGSRVSRKIQPDFRDRNQKLQMLRRKTQARRKTRRAGSKISVEGSEKTADSAKEQRQSVVEPERRGGAEEHVTADKLEELAEIFAEADEDGEGGLDIIEFRGAMRRMMGEAGERVPDHELDIIFMRVDANCDQGVSWEEFISYMLLEMTGKEAIDLESMALFPDKGLVIPSPHKDSIFRILWYNKGGARLPIPQNRPIEKYVRYITVSLDGVVCVWDSEFVRTKQRTLTEFKGNVLDVAILPKTEYLVASISDRSLVWYNLIQMQFDYLCKIIHYYACPTSLLYFNPSFDEHCLLVGDDNGSITCISFDRSPSMTSINTQAVTINSRSKKQTQEFQWRDFVLGRFDHIYVHISRKVHKSDVDKMYYADEMDAIISCCKDGPTALAVSTRTVTGTLTRPHYFVHPQSIVAFCYSKVLNIIVTGGNDPYLRVWNANVNTAPSFILAGHQNPVVSIHVHETREAVISLSELWEIMLTDLNSQSCLQQVFLKHAMDIGPKVFSSGLFYEPRDAIIAGTTKLCVFEAARMREKDATLSSHSDPVIKALYNPVFNKIVTAGWDSMVKVWDFANATRVLQFRAYREETEGGIVDKEVTALSFDELYRRLFTGSCDGIFRIWNFNNGDLLRELEDPYAGEICSILNYSERIWLGGSSRCILAIIDDYDEDDIRELIPSHSQEITCLAHSEAHDKIASCSYSGNIFIWNVSTCHVTCCFNPRVANGKPLSSWYAKSSQKHSLGDDSGDKFRMVPLGKRRFDEDLEDWVWEKSLSTVTSQGSLVGEDGEDLADMGEEASDAVGMSDATGGRLRKSVETSLGSTRDDVSAGSTRKNTSIGSSKKTRDSHESDGFYAEMKTSAQQTVADAKFIPERKVSPSTATFITACTDGYIYSWSIHILGGLLDRFHAAKTTDISLSTIGISSDGKYMVTADALGYIKVWFIEHYCLYNQGCTEECETRFDDDFRFVKWKKNLIELGLNADICKPEHRNIHLLSAFRGHTDHINSVDVIDLQVAIFILTASVDCSVRLFTVNGDFVGVYALHKKHWNMAYLELPPWRDGEFLEDTGHKFKLELRKEGHSVPPDVRESSSATTLYVLRARRFGLKWLAYILSMRWIAECQVKRRARNPSGKVVTRRFRDSVRTVILAQQFQRLSEKRHGSQPMESVLGKSYKKRFHHRATPKIKVPMLLPPICPAFRALPEVDMKVTFIPEDDPFIKSMKKEYKLPPLDKPHTKH